MRFQNATEASPWTPRRSPSPFLWTVARRSAGQEHDFGQANFSLLPPSHRGRVFTRWRISCQGSPLFGTYRRDLLTPQRPHRLQLVMNMSGGFYSGSIERERRAIERQSAKLARNLYLCSSPGVRNTSSLDYLALSEEFSMEVVGSIKKSF